MPDRPATFRDLVERLAKEERVPSDLAFGIITRESSGKMDATGTPVDVNGQPERARGFFQLMPAAAYDEGVNREDPEQNIRGGLRYIRKKLDLAKGNPEEALMRYHGGDDPANWGPVTRGYARDILDAVRPGGRGAPPAAAAAPSTTPATTSAAPATPKRGAGGAIVSSFLESKIKPYGPEARQARFAKDRESLTATPPPDPRRFEHQLPSADNPALYIGDYQVVKPRIGRTALKQSLGVVGEVLPAAPPGPERNVLYRTDIGTPPEIAEAWRKAEYEEGGGPAHPEAPWVEITRQTSGPAGIMVSAAKGAQMGGPTPAGKLLGGAAGAVVGGVTSSLAQSALEAGASAAGVPGAPPVPDLPTVLSRAAYQGGAGAVGEATGAGLNAATVKLKAPFTESVRPYAQEAIETFTDPKTGKVLVGPSEVSSSRTLGVAQNITEGALYGGGPSAALRPAREENADLQVIQQLGEVGPLIGETRTGQGAEAGRTRLLAGFRERAKQLWQGQFYPRAEKVPGEAPSLNEYAEALIGEKGHLGPSIGLRLAEEIAAQAPAPSTEELATLPSTPPRRQIGFGVPQGETATEAIARLKKENAAMKKQQAKTAEAEPPATAADLHRTVSALGRYAAQLKKAAETDPKKHNYEYGIVNELWKRAKADLEKTLNRTDPEAARIYARANAHWRAGQERYFNEDIRGLMDKHPEQFTNALIKPRNSTVINMARKATGAEPFKAVSAEALRQLIDKSRVKGDINFAQLAKDLRTLGAETREAMWPGGHGDEVLRVADLMDKLRKKPAGDVGRLGIQMTQAAGASALPLAIFTGVLGPKAAMALAVPYTLSRVMASKKGLQWLTTGLTAGQSTLAGQRAIANLTAFAISQQQQLAEPPELPQVLGGPPVTGLETGP